MNERQFQGELVADVPTSVPDSLRDRVDAIAADASLQNRPRSAAGDGSDAGRTLGLTDVIRQRRTLVMLVLAAILAIGAVGLGTLIRLSMPA